MSIGFLLGILGLFAFFTVVTFGSLYFHQLTEKEKQAQATSPPDISGHFNKRQ